MKIQESTAHGPGRVMVLIYGIFAVAATARAAYQLITKGDQAPVAYALSLVAGLLYVLATVALARGMRRLAWIVISCELLGVLLVGTLSVMMPQAFPDSTVWSQWGIGYGLVPLALPVLGLWWLWRTQHQPGDHEPTEIAVGYQN